MPISEELYDKCTYTRISNSITRYVRDMGLTKVSMENLVDLFVFNQPLINGIGPKSLEYIQKNLPRLFYTVNCNLSYHNDSLV